MAIQINTTESNGGAHPTAYVKVGAFQIFPDEKKAVVWLDYYHDRTYAPVSTGNPNGASSPNPYSRRVGITVENLPAVSQVLEDGVEIQAAVPAQPNFDTYFALARLNGSGANPIKNTYAAIKALNSVLAAGTDV